MRITKQMDTRNYLVLLVCVLITLNNCEMKYFHQKEEKNIKYFTNHLQARMYAINVEPCGIKNQTNIWRN